MARLAVDNMDRPNEVATKPIPGQRCGGSRGSNQNAHLRTSERWSRVGNRSIDDMVCGGSSDRENTRSVDHPIQSEPISIADRVIRQR